MKKHLAILTILAAGAANTAICADIRGNISPRNVEVTHRSDNTLCVQFTMELDSLDMPAGRAAIFTPVYTAGGETVAFPPVVVAGRKEIIAARRTGLYEGMNVVQRHNGTEQSIPYAAATAWEQWMEEGQLILHEDYCGCGLTTDGPQRLLAVTDFTPLPEPAAVYLAPAAEAVKMREAHGSAFLDFPVNVTDIIPTYRSNTSELKKITGTIDLMRNDPNTEISAIYIHGFASPEGSYANNTRLAQGRAKALADYVASLYSFPQEIFTVTSTPENWAGLREAVVASTLPDRDALLAVIDSPAEPDAREATLKRKHPASFAVMKRDIFPALRRSDYTVRYIVRPFTPEETMRMIRTNPSQVSQAELFAAAGTLPPGSPEFNELMELAVRMFPDDPTANLNAAVTAIGRGELKAARKYLDKAGDSPQATHALAIIAYNEGNLDEALRLMEKSGVAPESNLLMVRKAIARKNKNNN